MEKKNHKLLILLLASVIPFLLFSGSALSATPRRRGFDYFVLALQWPGTICRHTKYCCRSNGCCRSKPLLWFTIHGLWPQYNYGGWPSCCRHSRFDIKKILMLMPTLEKYWPSLYCGSSSTCFGRRGPFWVHEWEKHGTCGYPVIQGEYDYFSTALYLYSKYNVMKVLERAGIQASSRKRYAARDIIDSIEDAFGASPILVCKSGSIQELRLCFYKDFEPRDCVIGSAPADATSNRRSSCPLYIRLPTYLPFVAKNASGGVPHYAQADDEMPASLTTG